MDDNAKIKSILTASADLKTQLAQDTELIQKINESAAAITHCLENGGKLLLCGNGGSAANALHMANDLHYGIGACGSDQAIVGMRVEALPSNSGIITCLANDTGYENIYAQQLKVKADPDDIVIVLSGSGNSPNVVNALLEAKELNMMSYAIVAFDGGRCKELADEVIHFEIDDMQIAEDTQLVVGHLCMQWLNAHKPNRLKVS